MNDLHLAVHANMRFHPEVPLLPLPRLMHLRIAFLLAVLRRTWSVNNGRIDNGAGGDLDATALEMKVDRLQHGSAKCMLLQQVAEFADCRFVRHRLVAEIDLREAAYQRRVV